MKSTVKTYMNAKNQQRKRSLIIQDMKCDELEHKLGVSIKKKKPTLKEIKDQQKKESTAMKVVNKIMNLFNRRKK